MKKEKTVRTYQRRTKSGKIVTVRQHTAKYDAAEKAKEMAKKKGSGDELERKKVGLNEMPDHRLPMEEYLDELKKKRSKDEDPAEEPKKKKRPVGTGTNGPEKKKTTTTTKKTAKSTKASEPAFTAADYKAWYHWDKDADPKNASAKKVEKALKAKLGAKGYKKYFDEMTDSWSARGHSRAFKALGMSGDDASKASKSTGSSTKSVHPKNLTDDQIREHMKKTGKYVFKKNGEVWYKGSKSKPQWQASIEGYRKSMVDDYKEQSAERKLKKYAKEYGFNEGDVKVLSTFGISKPKRKMSDVSPRAAKNYSRFEDIPARQAKLELMMMSKKEHDSWDTFNGFKD